MLFWRNQYNHHMRSQQRVLPFPKHTQHQVVKCLLLQHHFVGVIPSHGGDIIAWFVLQLQGLCGLLIFNYTMAKMSPLPLIVQTNIKFLISYWSSHARIDKNVQMRGKTGANFLKWDKTNRDLCGSVAGLPSALSGKGDPSQYLHL
jgi:hypothetical protein